MNVYYTTLFIITRFQNSLPSCSFIISQYMYPSLLHKMAPFCMNTTKKSSGEGPLHPPPLIIHINTEKNQYLNIPATKCAILRASSLQNVMQNIESQFLPPLLNLALPPPPPIFFFFFCFFKNLLRLKIFCPRFSWKYIFRPNPWWK